MYAVREDMAVVEVTEEDTEDRRPQTNLRPGDPSFRDGQGS